MQLLSEGTEHQCPGEETDFTEGEKVKGTSENEVEDVEDFADGGL